MAVYYKFKSAKDYDSIAMDGPFISVGTLKEKIIESKHLGRGTDFDLLVTNAQTNEEYLDEAMLIPKNTSVLIRRVPGWPRIPIVTEPEPKVELVVEDTQSQKSSFRAADSSVMIYNEDTEWDKFGNDLYAIPEAPSVQSSVPLPDAPPANKADEDSKIKALIDTPALDWQRQGSDGFGPGRGFGRGMGGRMGGRSFGLEHKTPPQGYVCHRCKVPGHFIQHCPTNGDPKYDVKRFKQPTGIPKSMLIATPDGSYALPTGAVAVLKPNEAAFEKEIEGLPSTRPVGDLPPELHCPLCKEVMKDAVLTSKCCFKSFCDRCIRDHIISKPMCVCGATNILADDLLPNKTLRDTINRILESGNSSAENAGSTFRVQDMESARLQPKVPSPNMSAASKGEQKPLPIEEEILMQETTDEGKDVIAPQQVMEKLRAVAKAPDVSEATPASQGSAPLVEEEVQQKIASGEAGKKKKKKVVRMPGNGMPPNDLQWNTRQDLAAESYMMPRGPSAYNPYWTGFQPGIEGYEALFGGGMPYMGYGMGPLDKPFGGVMPQDPFMQGYTLPVVPPQRDRANFGMGMNVPHPVMSREEFEARKADLRRKRENERQSERELSRDRDYAREVSSSAHVSLMKPNSKSNPQSSSADHNYHYQRPRRFSPEAPLPLPCPSKRKSEHHCDYDYDYHCERERHHHHQPYQSKSSSKHSSEIVFKSMAEKKHKLSSFSRISFREGEATKTKTRKSSSSSSVAAAATKEAKPSSNGYHEDYKSFSAKLPNCVGGVDYESSDDDRHFKRKPSRYEASPQPSQAVKRESRHSRGSIREHQHR
ncbi:E3 ubiquitin ligase PQT3-like [Mangifera indica]|uniref:E3 ubiquitin ligase PQT3-like n=1 Tax=Mangifera indica TaxID=29780 RepID=UPI001CFB0511|nr:E3 ubiquitin ligase PQT3-like [Mangifera indica]